MIFLSSVVVGGEQVMQSLSLVPLHCGGQEGPVDSLGGRISSVVQEEPGQAFWLKSGSRSEEGLAFSLESGRIEGRRRGISAEGEGQ